MYIYIYSTHTYLPKVIYMYVCITNCIYIYMYVYMHICIHMHPHARTRTHIPKGSIGQPLHCKRRVSTFRVKSSPPWSERTETIERDGWTSVLESYLKTCPLNFFFFLHAIILVNVVFGGLSVIQSYST